MNGFVKINFIKFIFTKKGSALPWLLGGGDIRGWNTRFWLVIDQLIINKFMQLQC